MKKNDERKIDFPSKYLIRYYNMTAERRASRDKIFPSMLSDARCIENHRLSLWFLLPPGIWEGLK